MSLKEPKQNQRQRSRDRSLQKSSPTLERVGGSEGPTLSSPLTTRSMSRPMGAETGRSGSSGAGPPGIRKRHRPQTTEGGSTHTISPKTPTEVTEAIRHRTAAKVTSLLDDLSPCTFTRKALLKFWNAAVVKYTEDHPDMAGVSKQATSYQVAIFDKATTSYPMYKAGAVTSWKEEVLRVVENWDQIVEAIYEKSKAASRFPETPDITSFGRGMAVFLQHSGRSSITRRVVEIQNLRSRASKHDVRVDSVKDNYEGKLEFAEAKLAEANQRITILEAQLTRQSQESQASTDKAIRESIREERLRAKHAGKNANEIMEDYRKQELVDDLPYDYEELVKQNEEKRQS